MQLKNSETQYVGVGQRFHLTIVCAIVGLIITQFVLASKAEALPASYFSLFTLPDLVRPDKASHEFFRDTHAVLANTIFFVAVLHALAALKHHFFDAAHAAGASEAGSPVASRSP